jgi:hypothetical protein
MRGFVMSLVACVALSACAQQPKMTWLRADGQRSLDNPAVKTQFELDSTACLGERNKAALSGVTFTGGGLAGLAAAADRSNAADTVARGCMAEKGYLLVPEEQAEAKRQELAMIAQQQKAQAAPPPAPPPQAAKKSRVIVAPPPKQVARPAPASAPPASIPAAAVVPSTPEPAMSEADRAMNNRN